VFKNIALCKGFDSLK